MRASIRILDLEARAGIVGQLANGVGRCHLEPNEQRMTINLLTSVPEGLVMATDSMLSAQTFQIPLGFAVTNFEHANKLFELGTDACAAVMINGTGSIGATLVSQLIQSASKKVDARIANGAKPTHQDLIDIVASEVTPHYVTLIASTKLQQLNAHAANPATLAMVNQQRAQRGEPPLVAITLDEIGVANDPTSDPNAPIKVQVPNLSLIVASYNDNREASELKWPGSVTNAINLVPATLWWDGSGTSAVSRLIKGYDDKILEQMGASNPQGAQALAFVKANEARLQMPVAITVMPLQEAIYLTEFLGQVAAGFDHFRIGPPGVGGDLSVLTLTASCRTWIRRNILRSGLGKHYSGWSGVE